MTEMSRFERLAAVLLMIAGLVLTAASFLAVGESQSWDVADAFAADSVRPIRHIGMLLSVLGLAVLVVSLPVVVARLYSSPGFTWAAGGWVGFASGAVFFLMVLGLTAIAMPALGELASSGAVSPQQVVDRFVRQPAIMVAFLGGNLMFLSWVPIGIGLGRSGVFPKWLGRLVTIAALTAWLGFLHVPGIERYAGPLWPLAIALIGVHFLRGHQRAA